MLSLEQNTTRKEQVDENATKLAKLDVGNDENSNYKIEAICNNMVYKMESAGHILGLYYLISWKSYLEKENT